MKTVLLIDSQALTRIGLRRIIEDKGLVFNAIDGNLPGEAAQFLVTLKPDLLIADCFSDPAFTTDDLTRLTAAHPQLPVLLLHNYLQRTDVLKLTDTGFNCILSKNASEQEVSQAVDAALSHKKFLCNSTSLLISGNEKGGEPVTLPALSVREKEIVLLIAEGLPDNAIAQKLFLSFHTVRTHRKNISKKLGFSLKNAAELVWLVSYLNDLI